MSILQFELLSKMKQIERGTSGDIHFRWVRANEEASWFDVLHEQTARLKCNKATVWHGEIADYLNETGYLAFLGLPSARLSRRCLAYAHCLCALVLYQTGIFAVIRVQCSEYCVDKH